jgi:hypothetical protein
MTRLVALCVTILLIAASRGYAGDLSSQKCDKQDRLDSGRQGCACVAVATPGRPIGTLLNVVGDVKKSGVNGYAPVQASAPVFLGDSVLVGDKGSALLKVGECQHLMGSNSSFMVRESRGCGCVAVTEAEPGTGGGAGAVVAVGAGAGLLLLAGHSSPTSP